MAAIKFSKPLLSPVSYIWKAPLAHCHSASPISFSLRLIYYQQIAIRLRVHTVGHPSSVFADSQPISLRGSLSLSSGCSRNRSRTGNPFDQKLMYKSYLDSLQQDDTMEGPVEEETLQKIEEAYQLLNDPDNEDAEKCHSLLKKYLTRDVVDKLKDLRTDLGATLWDCIMSGVANLDSGVGIYAPDSESYTKFSDLFYPVIQDYHIGFNLKAGQKHPAADFGVAKANFADLDPTGDFIISTRTRCGRSLAGYPFNPLLNEGQYKEMESKVKAALEGLPGELAGTYYPLLGMTKETQTQLINDHFLFKEGDRFLQAANACRHWPVGRGIFHNASKTFLVWVNEEDHLRIISMQMGGDLLTVYKRMVAGVSEIEKKLPFSHDDNLGFLTFCPTNLGTTIRASVHIKLPKLSKNMDSFKKVSAEYNLQVRGTHGEHTESEGGVYDVSNKRRMGLTEFDAVKEMYEGIKRLIELEKAA